MADDLKSADKKEPKKSLIEQVVELTEKARESGISYAVNFAAVAAIISVLAISSAKFGLGVKSLLITFIVALVFNSFALVPRFHYGVHQRFGRRTGRIFKEGISLKLPVVDSVELVSEELAEITFSASFTTKDRIQLRVAGSMQYRPDRDIENRDGRNVFIEMSEGIITKGISEVIETKLGALGGIKESKDFIENRQAIGDILNCFFRLGTPPHLNHNPAFCGVADCAFSTHVSAADLIDFYNSHWKSVKTILGDEHRVADDHSPFEERYGIDVVSLPLPVVDFSDETKQAFEKEQQAGARQRAFDKKMEMAKKAVELGASPEAALNAADVSLEPGVAANKRIFSIEGAKGLINVLLGNQTRGGP